MVESGDQVHVAAPTSGSTSDRTKNLETFDAVIAAIRRKQLRNYGGIGRYTRTCWGWN